MLNIVFGVSVIGLVALAFFRFWNRPKALPWYEAALNGVFALAMGVCFTMWGFQKIGADGWWWAPIYLTMAVFSLVEAALSFVDARKHFAS